MQSLNIRAVIYALVGLSMMMIGQAMADDKKTSSCPENLMVEQTLVGVVAEKRGQAERQISELAVRISTLQAKVQLMMKENADLKAKVETLTPKTEDPAPK
jgi:peptidoglycan hydrolase CwlO-like protein